MIIGLCGYPRSGKDEAAKALTALGWKRIAFADPVRAGLLAIDPDVVTGFNSERLSEVIARRGWDEAKKHPEVRRLLQRYATEASRDIHGQDCWVNLARKQLAADSGCNYIITDVRFANEAAMIREMGGCIVMINHPGTSRVNDHCSEDYPFSADCVITNNGSIEDLHSAMIQAANLIRAANI
jgi:hypothetical protein